MRKIRLALLIAVGLALAFPVSVLRSRRRGSGTVRWWMRRVANVLGLDIVVHGTPAPGPTLWCANHVSWLDMIALGTLGDIVFVSKSEVRDWPLVGRCAAAAGTLFLRRGSGSDVAASVATTLRSGQAVAFFPEGTTGTGERLGRFHSRLFAAAMDTDAMVQPVALRFSEGGEHSTVAPFVDDDEFLPHLLQVLACGSLRVEIAFPEAINPVWQADRRALARTAEVAVATCLGSLPPLARQSRGRRARRFKPVRI